MRENTEKLFRFFGGRLFFEVLMTISFSHTTTTQRPKSLKKCDTLNLRSPLLELTALALPTVHETTSTTSSVSFRPSVTAATPGLRLRHAAASVFLIL